MNNAIQTFSKYYIKFDNLSEFSRILDRYKALGFGYKFGTLDDAIEKVQSTTVDKVTFKN